MSHSLAKQLDHTLKSYLENQELHRRKVGLKEEFRRLALEHGLDPDHRGQLEK